MTNCKQCSKHINKLTNKFYRTYGKAISYIPKTGKIETDLAFCSRKCMYAYQDLKGKKSEDKHE